MLNEVESRFQSKKIRASLAARATYLKEFYKPNEMNISVSVHSDYAFAGWKGASLYSEKESFQNKFVSKALFEEYGDSIVRRNYYTFDLD